MRHAIIICLAVQAAVATGGIAVAAGPEVPPPSLADYMTLMQLRHFKLWYAERSDNWPLARYELRQMREVMARTSKVYPEAAAAAQSFRLSGEDGPILDELGEALKAEDSKRFEAGFGRLTESCNACHRAAGVDFIAVQVPKRSPFSNQEFPADKP